MDFIISYVKPKRTLLNWTDNLTIIIEKITESSEDNFMGTNNQTPWYVENIIN